MYQLKCDTWNRKTLNACKDTLMLKTALRSYLETHIKPLKMFISTNPAIQNTN